MLNVEWGTHVVGGLVFFGLGRFFKSFVACSRSASTGHRTFHPVADRNDGIEIVETGRVVLPVGGSCKGILYN